MFIAYFNLTFKMVIVDVDYKKSFATQRFFSQVFQRYVAIRFLFLITRVFEKNI